MPLKYPDRPCQECPWRTDVHRRRTDTAIEVGRAIGACPPPSSVDINAPLLACREEQYDGREILCAGWLASPASANNLALSIEHLHGGLPRDCRTPASIWWPQLHQTIQSFLHIGPPPQRTAAETVKAVGL